MLILITLLIPLIIGLTVQFIRIRTILKEVVFGGGVAILGLTLYLSISTFINGPSEIFGGIFYVDALSAFLVLIIGLVSFSSIIYSIGYMVEERSRNLFSARQHRVYYARMFIFISSMLLSVTAGNLGVLWVGVEATTLTSAILVGFYRKESSIKAAWKYILICSVGITFALFGTILVYYASINVANGGLASEGTLYLPDLMRLAPLLNRNIMSLAFLFLLIGYGTKTGLVPMHTWLPEAHSEAPSPVSALLSGVLISCAMYAILRFYGLMVQSVGMEFPGRLLLIFGLASMIVAAVMIFVQQDIKRLLAYSSIEHMGIIAFGVGTGGGIGLAGAIMHLFNHALTKTLLFFVAGNLMLRYKSKYFSQIKGLTRVMPATAWFLTAGALALTGSPPFSIFLSEFTILRGSFSRGAWLSGTIFLIPVVLIFAGIIYRVIPSGGPYHCRRVSVKEELFKFLKDHHASPIQGNVHIMDAGLEVYHHLCLHVARHFRGRIATCFATDETSMSQGLTKEDENPSPLPSPQMGEGKGEGGFGIYTVFSLPEDIFIAVRLYVHMEGMNADRPIFPSLTINLPSAGWFEREIHDQFGLIPLGHPDLRPLVHHEEWPEGYYPMRKDFTKRYGEIPRIKDVFTHPAIKGEGVFEIPVGPVHAGIIEPGHFRFFSVGEDALHLEARLFYKHKGIEKLCEGKGFMECIPLIERVSGVSSVAHAISYSRAIEAIAQIEIPPRASFLRVIAAEMERLYNHTGDVGNMCAGTGLIVPNIRGANIKERLMRLNAGLTGHRYLMNTIVPGGVCFDLDMAGIKRLRDTLFEVEPDFEKLIKQIRRSSTNNDRLEGTGRLPTDTALALGAVGVSARASGVRRDVRRDHPYEVYDRIDFDTPVEKSCDVMARMNVRILEVRESLKIVRWCINNIPEGVIHTKIEGLPAYQHGLGWSEGPRGEVFHWVISGEGNRIERCKIKPASFNNWMAVPWTLPGNIVPDFPLVNKSFELSYAGCDR